MVRGGIYHVTCRGNERRAIFKDDQDRVRFLDRLAESAETFQVRIYLYCLMPNHLHLVVETPLGNLSRFMSSVLTGYTIYYNRRHKRSGHLMQGRFNAQTVAGDEYLLKLGRYVHLNPVQVKAWRNRPLAERVKELRGYEWSSYREYAGLRRPSTWLVREPMLGLLAHMGRSGKPKAYAYFVEVGLANTDSEFQAMMASHPIAIGSREFIEEQKRLYSRAASGKLIREDVSFRASRVTRDRGEVMRCAKEVMGDHALLMDRRKSGALGRGFCAWALQRYAGLTQREIARDLGVTSGAAVCLMIKRVHGSKQFDAWRRDLDLLFKG